MSDSKAGPPRNTLIRLPVGHELTINRILGIFMLGLIGFLWLTRSPPPPINSANGTYESPCCGLVTLRDGTMQIGRQTVGYTVGRDKIGAYVMPSFYIDVADGSRFEVERRHNPLKIMMDKETEPDSLELITDEAVYTLRRQRQHT